MFCGGESCVSHLSVPAQTHLYRLTGSWKGLGGTWKADFDSLPSWLWMPFCFLSHPNTLFVSFFPPLFLTLIASVSIKTHFLVVSFDSLAFGLFCFTL